MSGLRLQIGHLYPDLNVTGDRGNVMALKQRAVWHGLNPAVSVVSLEETTDLTACDIICLAAGQDRQLDLIVADIRDHQRTALAEAIDAGVTVLAVGGMFPALGHTYVGVNGDVRAGLGLFDVTTELAPGRAVGNAAITVTVDGAHHVLIGFENKFGRTELGAGVAPLGRVLSGHGNNGRDRTEGMQAGNVYGTHLHGPILPRNPWLADHLLAVALRRRYRDATLRQLDDTLEAQAHADMVRRLGLAQ